ncbi:MAG: DnaD domain protein [Clostridia bacterium]|nr:DnaD domain protein [Clostridia bacterium]
MFFEANKSTLYSDTLVPDIFVSEYMPSMDGDCVKLYLYCLFLSKYNKQISTKDLAKKLGIDMDKTKDLLIYLESMGIISRKENSNGILLNDLKEKEINKMYRPKLTSSPEEAIQSSERNKRRNEIVASINNAFFQGLMPPSWYTDIDDWFDRYKFEEDVMYALFKYCYDNNGLHKNYIMAVASSWHKKNIVNSFDLDNYSIEYQKFKDVRGKIVKKLKLSRNLTEYEEEYVEKWFMEYRYDFDIIEIALKKTTAKTNPSLRYIDAILADWYKNGLKTKEEIIVFESAKKQQSIDKNKGKPKDAVTHIPQKGNFDQREYDDEYYDNLYDNVRNR